jgi:YesN/AraC family two-component response regulator
MVVPIARAIAHGPGTTRPVILTVDDEPSIRSAVFVIFEDEFDVLEAPDGQTALDLVRNRRVDLVLLDLRMPGLSGLTLLERLLTVKRDVKVILVTAVDEARTAAAAMKIGASDYLTKPFDVDELAGMVRRALGVRTDRTTQVAHAVVTGPQVEICTSVAVVLGARCGLDVEAVVSEALNVSEPAARHDICIDLSSFGQGLIRVARDLEAIDVRLRASFDFTGLLRELAEFLPLKPTCSRRPQDLIGRVMARVAADYSGTSVKRLANDLSMSGDHLSRAFRDEAAITIKQYIVRVRLEVAKCLLRASGDKVETIASRVGFYDAAHLSRVFHELIGVSPGRYRSSMANGTATMNA